MNIPGKDVKIYYLDETSAAVPIWECIAASKTCTLQVNQNIIEKIPSKNWRFKEFVDGKYEWQVNVSGLFTTANNLFHFLIYDYDENIKLRMSFKLDDDKGEGTLVEADVLLTTFSLEANKGKLSTYTATFKGSGPLKE